MDRPDNVGLARNTSRFVCGQLSEMFLLDVRKPKALLEKAYSTRATGGDSIMAGLSDTPRYKLTGMSQWRKLLKMKRLCRHDAKAFAKWLNLRGYEITDHYEILEYLYEIWELIPE